MESLRVSLDALRVVFRSPDLRRLELAGAGAITGQWGYAVALAVFAYRAGGATAVGVVGIAQTLPAAVLAPFAAVLGDRHRRERVMLASDLGRGASIGAAGAAALAGAPVAVVYALAAVAAIVATAFPPAQRAIMPSLARRPEELTAANAATSTIFSAGSFAGPALAGALLTVARPGIVLCVCACTFVWSGALISRIRTSPPPEAGHRLQGVAASALAGFRTIAGEAKLRLVVGLGAAQTFVRGALSVLIVVVALDLLDSGESSVGYFNGALGVGGLLGVALALALVGRRRLASDFGVGIFLWGLPLALIGVWPSAPVAVLLLGVVGLANTLVDVSILTLLQRSVDDRVLARVFGVLESLVTATVGVGAITAPLLISLLGARGALVLVGGLLPLLALISWRRLRRIDAEAAVPAALPLLRALTLFAPLPGPVLERVAARLQPVLVPAGERVLVEGERGDRFYVLEAGTAVVTHAGAELSVLGPGECFGEIALLRNVPRTATVTARSELALKALERDDFLAAVLGDPASAHAAAELADARVAADARRADGFGEPGQQQV